MSFFLDNFNNDYEITLSLEIHLAAPAVYS